MSVGEWVGISIIIDLELNRWATRSEDEPFGSVERTVL